MQRELAEEMEQHVAMKAAAREKSGMGADEARHAARREFGNALSLRERSQDQWGFAWLEGLLQDARYGARMLRRSPGFTATAVLTLALGIGANGAIFSAVNGILLVPLPYANPSRLVTVELNQIAYHITFAQFGELKQSVTALQHITWLGESSRNVSSTGSAGLAKIPAAFASGDFFSLLGVSPLLGRYIVPRDTQPGSAQVAVLSYGLWMREFGGDPGIVGRNIWLDHKPYTIIGVMPRGFGLGINWNYQSSMENPDLLWLPTVASSHRPQDRLIPVFIARLRPGATLEEAKAQLRVFTTRFSRTLPPYLQDRKLGFQVQELSLGINPRVQTWLWILWGAVGFVLLMACVNVASLLVARSWTRQGELAIRKAIGATRPRMIRQLLSESLLLALAGGVLGLLVSVWGIQALRAMAPPQTPRVDHIRLDASVLWFTMGISLLVAVLVGLAPALQATGPQAGTALKSRLIGSFAGASTRQSHLLRSVLIVAEVMLAVVLVVGGVLMGRSFYMLESLDTGVRASHVITMHVRAPAEAQGRGDRRQLGTQTHRKEKQSRSASQTHEIKACAAPYDEAILDGIQSTPGIQGAALSMSGVFHGGFAFAGVSYPGGPRDLGLYVEGHGRRQLLPAGVVDRPVTPSFFSTVGIQILKGRDFDSGDVNRSDVAIASENFALAYIPGNPLGKYFSVGAGRNGRHHWIKVIGVVNDVQDRAVYGKFTPGLVYYTPYSFSSAGPSGFDIVARTSANPMVMVPAIKHVVRSVNDDARVTHIETVNQILDQSSAEPRFETLLFGSFGVLGLLLAVVGVYGVISYSMVQRTREIGVRVALGAQRKDILGMILGEGMALAAIGIALGIGGAAATTWVLRSMLFEITPTDPATFIGVAMLLALAALSACWIPARRAMRVDPMVALRHE
jgi:predicted permease